MRLEDLSIHAWLQEYGIKTEKGSRIDLYDHLYLFKPYTDFSPEMVVYKAAQIGFSVLAVLKTFYVAKKLGLDIIYTMPTDKDVEVFVGGKVNRIIRNNEILQKYTADKDSVYQKQIGDSMIYFRGAITKRAAISVTADLLVHDEEDFSDQEIIGDYDSRLQHSKFKWKWHFGHPTAPGIGVSSYWPDSDQKHWFIKCPGCNKNQYMSWPESVCLRRQVYQCKYCQKELSDENRRQGQWVEKYRNKRYSGYWIPLLIAPWIKASYVIDKQKKHTAEYFTNRILGLPYVGGGNKIMPEDILGCVKPEINNQDGRIVIGVDTGVYLRYVVGNTKGIFFHGQTKKYSDIKKLLNRWPKSIAVCDQGGDIIGVRELVEEYPGRVFLAHYRSDRRTMQLVNYGKGDEARNVMIDRNRMIQLVIDEFKQRRITLNGTREEWQPYWEHWDNIYRVAEEDNLGVIKYKWKRSGRDDWVHCLNGDTLITTNKGKKKIKDVQVGDYVLTRKGFNRVYKSGMTYKEADVIEAVFTNGRKIIGTPTHRVWTNKGWKHLKDITSYDILEGVSIKEYIKCELKSLIKKLKNLMVGNINYTKVKDILQGVEVGVYIGMSGNNIMVKLVKNITYTIKTIIQLTIKSKIWKRFIIKSIYENIIRINSKKKRNALYADVFIWLMTLVKTSIAQFVACLSFMVKSITKLSVSVLCVVLHLPRIVIGAVSLVRKNVRLKELNKLKEKTAVYNISVENQHEYYANDLLVANSTVYWRAGMARVATGDGFITGGIGEATGIRTAPEVNVYGKMPNVLALPKEDIDEDWNIY